jgi:hypothetical protein
MSLAGIDVWADEAIERVWIDSIQPCPCAVNTVEIFSNAVTLK